CVGVAGADPRPVRRWREPVLVGLVAVRGDPGRDPDAGTAGRGRGRGSPSRLVTRHVPGLISSQCLQGRTQIGGWPMKNALTLPDEMQIPAPSPARTPLTLLDEIQIATPCPARWDDMVGGNRSRHCHSCDRTVYDLSQLTTQQ